MNDEARVAMRSSPAAHTQKETITWLVFTFLRKIYVKAMKAMKVIATGSKVLLQVPRMHTWGQLHFKSLLLQIKGLKQRK